MLSDKWLSRYRLLENDTAIVTHYANLSVQYTAIFHGYKNDYFQIKNCNIFPIFAQNIDRGYT